MAQNAKHHQPDLISEKEAAAILGVTPNRLARDRWEARQQDCSPAYPYYKIGKHVRYDRADILAVIAASRVS